MSRLCAECVTDRFLRAWVEEQGEETTCTYCDQDGVCVAVRAVAQEIDRTLRQYYQLAPDEPHVSPDHDNIEYYAEGETAEEIINDIVSSTDAVAEIVAFLSALEERNVRDGGDALYDSDALLEHVGTDTGGYLALWESFEQRLKHEVRFFDAHGREMLNELFGDLPQVGDGRAVVTLTPDEADLKIYRARIINDEAGREDFIRDPARHIGPPPPFAAKAGRMNPAGIPAFYGAFSAHVALAEIRPPVGSLVAVGEFSLLRPVRLLDMSFLPFAYHNETMFSPRYDDARSKVKFLEVFHRRISRPVLPSDEALAYIPTQAVAAYVANVLGFDGIIYSSTQVGAEGESTGDQLPRTLCNVVLFGQAAVVERTPAPPRPPYDEPLIDPFEPVGFPGWGPVAPAAPARAGDAAREATETTPAHATGIAAPGPASIPQPDGLGEGDVPATLRIKRDPKLERICAVKVETSAIFAHLYEDGRVLFDVFEDYDE